MDSVFGSWFKAEKAKEQAASAAARADSAAGAEAEDSDPFTNEGATAEVEALQKINAELRDELVLVKEKLNLGKLSKVKSSRRNSQSQSLVREVIWQAF